MAIVSISSDLGLFHVNEALSQFAQGYAQDADSFIASQIAPVINVDSKSDVYYVGQTEHLQLSDTSRAPGSLFPQVEWAVSESAYTCKSYGVEVSMGWELPKNADAALDVEQENVTLAVDRLMLASEYRTMYQAVNGGFTAFDSGKNFANSGTNTKWDAKTTGVSTQDPYDDVEVAKEGILNLVGHLPNTLVMNYPTYRAVLDNTFIKDRVKYTEAAGIAGVITNEALCRVFDVEQILVGKAVYDTATPGSGAVPSMSYIWPNAKCFVAYIDNRIGPLRAKILAPLRTFVWTAMGGRFASRSYVFDPRMSNVVQCVDYVDENVTCTGAMAIIQNCTS